MHVESELPQPPQAMDDIAPHEPIPDPTVPDSLKEVRDLKLRVQIGVYGTILAFVPFDAFLIRQSLLELFVNNLLYVLVGTIAIEFAFAQMFKLRKRSA